MKDLSEQLKVKKENLEKYVKESKEAKEQARIEIENLKKGRTDLNQEKFSLENQLAAKGAAIKEAQYLIKLSDRDNDGRISEYEMLSNFKLFTGSDLSKYALHLLERDL